MADNAEVMAGIARQPGVRYSVLTPNLKGFEAALPCKPDEIVVFGAASEAFSQRNINCSIEESVERFRPVVAAAKAAGIKVRAAVSCALGCPYQGEVTPDEVERVVVLMKAIGVEHCGIADTIGVGTPRRVQAAMERALKHFPLAEVSGHFHDTYGQSLANIYACLETRHPRLRRQRRRARRLPLCEGRDRQRRDRGRAVHAARPGHRDRHRPRCAGRRGEVHLRRARPEARVALGQCAAREAGGGDAMNDGASRHGPKASGASPTRSPRAGIRTRRVFLDIAARTAQEAADALGVGVGQIAKSIVFRRRSDDAAVLVVTSGDRRVDEAKVAERVGALGRADAAFVKATTSFTIGGVAPVGHVTTPVMLIDRELFRFELIWAAAGHPNGVFRLTPQELAELTGAPVEDVTS